MIAFEIVVAADEEHGIGKAGQLPWRLRGDMAFFKRLTLETRDAAHQNAVIMGRKTWDSIPPRFRPLKGRLNVVVTRQAALEVPEGVLTAASVEKALACVAERGEAIERVFVIGGGEIYRAALAHDDCREVHLTRVAGAFACDTHFPKLDEGFELVDEKVGPADGSASYSFQRWRRRSAE